MLLSNAKYCCVIVFVQNFLCLSRGCLVHDTNNEQIWLQDAPHFDFFIIKNTFLCNFLIVFSLEALVFIILCFLLILKSSVLISCRNSGFWFFVKLIQRVVHIQQLIKVQFIARLQLPQKVFTIFQSNLDISLDSYLGFVFVLFYAPGSNRIGILPLNFPSFFTVNANPYQRDSVFTHLKLYLFHFLLVCFNFAFIFDFTH